MPILVMCQDSENGTELRKKHVNAHLEYIETVVAMICVAGPISQSARGMEQNLHEGSCFIYDTEDIAVARKLLEHDPFSKAGVYSQVAFAKFSAAAGHWIGGITWEKKG